MRQSHSAPNSCESAPTRRSLSNDVTARQPQSTPRRSKRKHKKEEEKKEEVIDLLSDDDDEEDTAVSSSQDVDNTNVSSTPDSSI